MDVPTLVNSKTYFNNAVTEARDIGAHFLVIGVLVIGVKNLKEHTSFDSELCMGLLFPPFRHDQRVLPTIPSFS